MPATMEHGADPVERAVRDALAAIRPTAKNLDANADLAASAGLDSAEVMDLVMEIEDELDLSIPVEALARARTIAELCGVVRPLLAAK